VTLVPVAPPLPPPSAPPAPPGLQRAGQGVREPKKIVDVRPVYPEIARNVKVQGVVILEAVINERGGVERIKVLRSVPLLDGAAIDAVKAWRYTPTTLNGVPVSVLMTITINFTLND
jgi:protein TonB